MGTVYRGLQQTINRPVAIKLIANHVARRKQHVHRFRLEAQAVGQLGHPNTVRLFDFGATSDGELYLIMELLRGSDVATQLLKWGQLSPRMALQITRAVMQALTEAHTLGIVHRDLKPANVFLASVDGNDALVKIMDFGVASLGHDPDASQLTTPGAAIGTPAYMSPEQAVGQHVDGRADLYAAGIMLFEMLTGRPPFEADTMFSLLTAHLTQAPPRLLEVSPHLDAPAGVQPLLDRLLAKSPESRPSSAAAVRDEINHLLAEYNENDGSSTEYSNKGASANYSLPSITEHSLLSPTDLQPIPAYKTPNAWSKSLAPLHPTPRGRVTAERSLLVTGFFAALAAIITSVVPQILLPGTASDPHPRRQTEPLESPSRGARSNENSSFSDHSGQREFLWQDTEGTTQKVKEQLAKALLGNIVFVAPKEMEYGSLDTVHVRISALSTIEQLRASLKDSLHDPAASSEDDQIQVYTVMEVNLTGAKFEKTAHDKARQLIDDQGRSSASWSWDIEPTAWGTHRLRLTAYAII